MSHFEMKNKGSKLISFFVAWAMMAIPFNSEALIKRLPSSINRAALVMTAPSSFFGPKGHAISPELIDCYNKVKSAEKVFDIAQIVPLNLQPSDNSGVVFSRIADQSVSTFLNSDELRATPFGKTATTVEQKLKQDLIINSGQVEHKLTFQLQAFQTIARVDYKGFTNATLRYQANSSSLGIEVYDKIPYLKNKDLVLSHVSKPEDRVSSLSVRWNF